MGSKAKLKILNYIILQRLSNIRNYLCIFNFNDCHIYCSEKREVLSWTQRSPEISGIFLPIVLSTKGIFQRFLFYDLSNIRSAITIGAGNTEYSQIEWGTSHFIFMLVTLYGESSCFNVKDKAIPVTGCGGPYGCKTLRLLHFLDNRLTDGGEAVSLTLLPPFISRKILGTHFC
jgi:hypothetical protein